LADKELVELVQQKDYAKIMTNQSFLKILNDDQLMKQLFGIAIKSVPFDDAGKTTVKETSPKTRQAE
jgi:hypothetical protein